MENKIVTKSLRRQLDQVVLHDQVENDTTINNNLIANQIDQQFETLRNFLQTKQRHLWTKERHVGHKILQKALIILHEVQTSEVEVHQQSTAKFQDGKTLDRKCKLTR